MSFNKNADGQANLPERPADDTSAQSTTKVTAFDESDKTIFNNIRNAFDEQITIGKSVADLYAAIDAPIVASSTARLQTKLDEVESELQNTKAELNSKTEANDWLKQENSRLLAQIQSQLNKTDNLEIQIQEARTELNFERQSNDWSKQEIIRLLVQFRSERKKADDLKTQIQAVRTELNNERKALNSTNQEIADLRTRLEKAEEEWRRVKSRHLVLHKKHADSVALYKDVEAKFLTLALESPTIV